MNGQQEIYIERQRVGNFLKVTAIDARTGVEAFVQGPLNANAEDLQKLAVQKLKRRLEQK